MMREGVKYARLCNIMQRDMKICKPRKRLRGTFLCEVYVSSHMRARIFSSHIMREMMQGTHIQYVKIPCADTSVPTGKTCSRWNVQEVFLCTSTVAELHYFAPFTVSFQWLVLAVIAHSAVESYVLLPVCPIVGNKF